MLKDGEIFAKGGKDIITTDTIEKLYDIKVNIIKENGRIFIIPELEVSEKKYSNF
jgi:ABC-type cobalamin/Fe3+-siderophores transport system ATPase subunit